MKNETYREVRAVVGLVLNGNNAQIFGEPELYEKIENSWIFKRPQLANATASFVDGLINNGSDILDVAAGTGMLTYALQGKGHNVVGLDLHEAMLKGMINKSFEGKPPTAVVGDMNQIPLRDGSFDVITTLRANRFIKGNSFYRESKRILREGGLLVLPVFSIDKPFWWIESGMRQHTSAEDITTDLYRVGFSDVQSTSGKKALNGVNIPPYYIPTYLVARK